jgi:hypothetical protein
MIVKPPYPTLLGIALAAAACSKADLPMQELLLDAALLEVGRIDVDYDPGGVYAWARDGKAFALHIASVRPLTWMPETDARLELDSVPHLGSICGIGAGLTRTGILCLHGVATDALELSELDPSDGSVRRILGRLPRDDSSVQLAPNASGNRILVSSPGDFMSWSPARLIECGAQFRVRTLALDGLDLLSDPTWLPHGGGLAFAGEELVTCGTGLEEESLSGGIGLLDDDGISKHFIYTWRNDAEPWNWRAKTYSNQRLIAFPDEMSVSPDGEFIVYLAFQNKLQRIGLLRTKSLTHARGHDVKRMHDILHLSNELLLVSPQGERAMLEIWDAKTFALHKQTRIPAGRQLLLNHDRTRLAVIDDKQIRAYRCVRSIDGSN